MSNIVLQENIRKLVSYINSLRDFKFYNQEEFKKEFFHRNHMGAIITDGVLQAGIKWEAVVKLRLKKLVEYKKAGTTTGFYNLYNQKGLDALINFNGRKIETIKNVVRLFIEEKIETSVSLKKWLQEDKNIKRLDLVYGIGPKTLDYFKILVGIPNTAIDTHVINFLRKAKITAKSYEEAHEIISKTADYLKINKSLLDYSIWKYMSSADKRKKKCKGNNNKQQMND